MIPITTSRDLIRYRPFTSPAIAHIAENFFNVLAGDDNASAQLRTAFLPALLRADARVSRDPATDAQLRNFFLSPPAVCVPHGTVTGASATAAWATPQEKGGVSNSVFIGTALHRELEQARSDGDRDYESNVSMMVLATLAHEVAHWIFTKTHGYNGPEQSDTSSVRTSRTAASYSSYEGPTSTNKDDVGIKACTALFGFDFQLITYTVGEQEIVKRKQIGRRSPLVTPPILYSLIQGVPPAIDVTAYPPFARGAIPGWRDPSESLYMVTSILTTAGVAPLHGVCVIKEVIDENAHANEYNVSFDQPGIGKLM